MKLFRGGIGLYPLFSGAGAAINGGRWNSVGGEVIYAATSLAGAKLEILAQAGGLDYAPKGYEYIEIIVPDDLPITTFPGSELPRKITFSRKFGDKWLREMVTSVALVPSAASPGDMNAIVNPKHPHVSLFTVCNSRPLIWDKRPFRLEK